MVRHAGGFTSLFASGPHLGHTSLQIVNLHLEETDPRERNASQQENAPCMPLPQNAKISDLDSTRRVVANEKKGERLGGAEWGERTAVPACRNLS